MSNNSIYTLAFSALAAGVLGAVAYGSLNDRINGLDSKLDGISKSMDGLSGSVDLTVPENIVKIAVENAAQKAANKTVDSAISSIKAGLTDLMSKRVTDAVNDAYKDMESGLKDSLQAKIDNTSIGRIETAVTDRVAKQVLKNFMSNNNNGRSSTPSTPTKTDAVKAMADNGYKSWEISDVLRHM